MLQDVRHAGGVRRVRLETDTEYIVLVISCYVEIICTSLVVLKVEGGKLQFRNVLCLLKCEAMDAIAWSGKGAEVGYGGVESSCAGRDTLESRVGSHEARRGTHPAQGGQHRTCSFAMK